MRETKDANHEMAEIESLATEIQLPVGVKNRLEVLCKKRGIAMRDYVEGLVQAALAVDGYSPGRVTMAEAAADQEHARFEEVRECKYGCGFLSESKSGLTQHEQDCTYQRSDRAQERADEAEGKRRVAEVKLI